MVNPIAPIAVNPLGSLSGPANGAAQRLRQAEPAATPAAGFGNSIADAIQGIADREMALDAAAEAAATGDLNSVNDYMITAAETQLATEITVAVRDRAISAFNDIMRMQL